MTVDHYARVLRWLERFIAEAAQGEPQRRLLDTALEGLRRQGTPNTPAVSTAPIRSTQA